jgi:hypothetical protein
MTPQVLITSEMPLRVGQQVLPARSLPITDLPLFDKAGFSEVPAMLMGLDILASGEGLGLHWSQQKMTLRGPFQGPKRGLADLELPLER